MKISTGPIFDEGWPDHEHIVDPAWLGTRTLASRDAVLKVIVQDDNDDDGRSPWMWIRLRNGDLILGTYPQGDTYTYVEGDEHQQEDVVDVPQHADLRERWLNERWWNMQQEPAPDTTPQTLPVSECPVCRSTFLDADPYRADDELSAFLNVQCETCQSTWTEIYEFDRRTNLKALGEDRDSWTAMDLIVKFGSSEAVLDWAAKHTVDLASTFDLPDSEMHKLFRDDLSVRYTNELKATHQRQAEHLEKAIEVFSNMDSPEDKKTGEVLAEVLHRMNSRGPWLGGPEDVPV